MSLKQDSCPSIYKLMALMMWIQGDLNLHFLDWGRGPILHSLNFHQERNDDLLRFFLLFSLRLCWAEKWFTVSNSVSDRPWRIRALFYKWGPRPNLALISNGQFSTGGLSWCIANSHCSERHCSQQYHWYFITGPVGRECRYIDSNNPEEVHLD